MLHPVMPVTPSVSITWRYYTAARSAVVHGEAKALSEDRQMNLSYPAPGEIVSSFAFLQFVPIRFNLPGCFI
jgi:hypothetical protein